MKHPTIYREEHFAIHVNHEAQSVELIGGYISLRDVHRLCETDTRLLDYNVVSKAAKSMDIEIPTCVQEMFLPNHLGEPSTAEPIPNEPNSGDPIIQTYWTTSTTFETEGVKKEESIWKEEEPDKDNLLDNIKPKSFEVSDLIMRNVMDKYINQPLEPSTLIDSDIITKPIRVFSGINVNHELYITINLKYLIDKWLDNTEELRYLELTSPSTVGELRFVPNNELLTPFERRNSHTPFILDLDNITVLDKNFEVDNSGNKIKFYE